MRFEGDLKEKGLKQTGRRLGEKGAAF